MVISTITSIDVNLALIWVLKEKNPNLIIICVASHIKEAITLYEKGMDYVIMPHYIWANYAKNMLEEFWLDVEKFMKNKTEQVEELKQKYRDSLFGELIKNK